MLRRLENVVSVLTDEDFFPFIVDRTMVRKAQELTREHDVMERYFSIYVWMVGNIRHEGKKGYRNSLEVFYQKEGVCGEQAYLFIALARAVGLEARYVSVFTDYKGKKVRHACVSVRGILVDTSYARFSVKHKKYKVLSDWDAGENYRLWRFGK